MRESLSRHCRRFGEWVTKWLTYTVLYMFIWTVQCFYVDCTIFKSSWVFVKQTPFVTNCSRNLCARWCSSLSSSLLSGRLKIVFSSSIRSCRVSGDSTSKGFHVPLEYVCCFVILAYFVVRGKAQSQGKVGDFSVWRMVSLTIVTGAT